jgi:predicted RNase H-like HicB family nuclease
MKFPQLKAQVDQASIISNESFQMKTKTFTAIISQDDNLFVADCPEVGTVSQGKTVDEAIANLKEATEIYLEAFPLKDSDFPLLKTFGVRIG